MELQIKEVINAPADKVWQVLGHQFADIGNWSTNVATSRALDSSEVPSRFKVAPSAPVPGRATPNPLGELKEILTMYSDNDKTFTFEVDGLPPIISHSQNTTKIIEQGSKECVVTFDLTMEPKGVFKLMDPILRRRFATSQRGPAGLMSDLKQFVESAE
jgi:hypothetical protein